MLSYSRITGFTVPRQGLYHSYSLSCEEVGIKPVNSASFGKAVRNTFPGIKTRRLGVRGNSKYHYVSIRPAIGIEAERLNEYGDSSGQWHNAPHGNSSSDQQDATELDSDGDEHESDDAFDANDFGSLSSRPGTSSGSEFHSYSAASVGRPTMMRRHTSSLVPVPNWATPTLSVSSLPGFPVLDLSAIPQLSSPILQNLWFSLCQGLDGLVIDVSEMCFDRFEVTVSLSSCT